MKRLKGVVPRVTLPEALILLSVEVPVIVSLAPERVPPDDRFPVALKLPFTEAVENVTVPENVVFPAYVTFPEAFRFLMYASLIHISPPKLIGVE